MRSPEIFAFLVAATGNCGAPPAWKTAYTVPGELPTEVWEGNAGSRLGAAVALHGGEVLAGAPGTGEVCRFPEGDCWTGPEGLGEWVWWSDTGSPFAARAEDAVYRLEEGEWRRWWPAEDAIGFAHGSWQGTDTVAVLEPEGVVLVQEQEERHHLTLAGARQVAVGENRILARTCEGAECRVIAWWPEDGASETLARVGEGGDLSVHEGLVWWGDPDEGEGGVVCSEAGTCVEGDGGDQLGRAVSGTWAAGVFNGERVPPSARVVPLQGGAELRVDRAGWGRPLSLAEQGGSLVVGLPTYGRHDGEEGRVILLESVP